MYKEKGCYKPTETYSADATEEPNPPDNPPETSQQKDPTKPEIDYGTLKDLYYDHLRETVETQNKSDPTRNARWAMKHWCTHLDVSNADRVHDFWGDPSEFTNKCHWFVDVVKTKSGKKTQTSRNLKREMKSWRNFYIELLRKSSLENKSFGETIKTLRMVIGLSRREAAKQLGMNSSTLRSWEEGWSVPSNRIGHLDITVPLMATLYGVQGEYLQEKAVSFRYFQESSLSLSEYGKRMSRIQRNKEFYTVPIPDAVKTSFDALALGKQEGSLQDSKGELVETGTTWKPVTTDMNRRFVKIFFSFVQNPENAKEHYKRGLGIKPEKCFFLMITDPDKLLKFANFYRDRNSNAETEDKKQKVYPIVLLNYFKLALSLLHEERDEIKGFLRNHPEYAGTNLPEMRNRKTWERWCDKRVERLGKYTRIVKKHSGKTRDQPDVEGIVRQEDPAHVIDELIETLKRSIPGDNAPVGKAAQHRDIVLMYLLRYAPARIRNLHEAKVWKHLVKRDGEWWLTFEEGELKNPRGGGKGGYERKLPHDSWQWIDTYLRKYHPYLLNLKKREACSGRGTRKRKNYAPNEEDSNCVFITRFGRPFRDPARLGRCVRGIFQKYTNKSIGPHALRHIMPTALLKDCPGEIDAAAALLGDSPRTVKMNYDQRDKEDHMRRVDRWEESRKKKAANKEMSIEDAMQRIEELEERLVEERTNNKHSSRSRKGRN